MIPNNACTLRITAAAGTELAGASSTGNVRSSSLLKELYDPKAFITHAGLLDQGFPHCPIFPTAASRGSLDRVPVPVWLIILSDQLPIEVLVGFYPTNKLIGRSPILSRLTALPAQSADRDSSFGISSGFPELSPAKGYVSYVLRTRAPL